LKNVVNVIENIEIGAACLPPNLKPNNNVGTATIPPPTPTLTHKVNNSNSIMEYKYSNGYIGIRFLCTHSLLTNS